MQYLKGLGRHIRWPKPYNTWTTTSKIVLVTLAVSLLQNAFYGLYPCYYSFKRRRFEFYLPLAVYCLFAATIFSAFYANHMWVEYTSGQIDTRDAIKIYCYMNACVCLINYVTQWAILVEVLEFQNRIPLFSTINYFNVSLTSTGRSLLVASLKMFAFPSFMQLTLAIYQKTKQPEHELMSTSKIMFPILVGNQINNCFFGGTVMTKAVLVQINIRLREILKEVNRLQTPGEMKLHKSYYRMTRFCELSDCLDELANKYRMATTNSMRYLELTAFSLVTSMTINLIITTLGVYTQYQFLADYFMFEQSYDIQRALAHCVFLVIPFSEILLVARVSEQVLSEAKEAGYLLQRINLEHADVRFKRTVDTFWFEVHTIKYKLMPLGLLELKGSMINKFLGTISGFLLFLIQNDLTFKYSLK